jgi:hypothetical protein
MLRCDHEMQQSLFATQTALDEEISLDYLP